MNARERLHAARRAADEGRYAEALSEYIWFHNHALEEIPSLYGVRLSFALGDWLELAGKYPPARASMKRIRDEKTKLLEDGAENSDLFSDVNALNDTLHNSEATYDLFCLIHRNNPAFAARCTQTALPAVIKAKDYKLARSLIPDPEQAIDQFASRFSDDIARANRQPSPEKQSSIKDVAVRMYANDVSMLAEIVGGTGEHAWADLLVEKAISLVANPDVRTAVRNAIYS